MKAAVLTHLSSLKEVSALFFVFLFFYQQLFLLVSLLSIGVARDTWPMQGKREPALALLLTEL